MSKSKPPVSSPDALPLKFAGLDLCDGCGARLAPGDQLAGLCAACERALSKVPRPRPSRRRERRP